MVSSERKTFHSGDSHSPYLAHHFSSLKQQYESSKLGMWLFLITEIMLFGGLFCAYAVYRANHPEIFYYGHKFLDVPLGALNTMILIFSSLTMALAVRYAQLGVRKLLILFLSITIFCGLVFLGVKYVEYEHKWKHGLMWGKYYKPQVEQLEVKGKAESVLKVSSSEESSLASTVSDTPKTGKASSEPKNVQTFFAIYFAMTGLHALHVLAGIFVLVVVLILAVKHGFGPENFTAVDLSGLYWHLVDLIWIYLFPLFYLIGA